MRIEFSLLVAMMTKPASHAFKKFNVSIKKIEDGLISAITFSSEKMAKFTKDVDGIDKVLIHLDGIMMPSVRELKSLCEVNRMQHQIVSGICIIGDFTKSTPNEKALEAVQKWIRCGIELGHVKPVHYIITHRQSQAPSYTEW